MSRYAGIVKIGKGTPIGTQIVSAYAAIKLSYKSVVLLSPGHGDLANAHLSRRFYVNGFHLRNLLSVLYPLLYTS